jgi:ubiquinone/menaquinone biosynthesis C-methylase UbiE
MSLTKVMNQPTFAQSYERWLVPFLFRPWAEAMIEELKLSPGDRVLDVACGTGIVARVAEERLRGGGSVVGVDLNREMLAVARAVAPAIDWREGSADALPLQEGEKFDVVVCQQGLQFFPNQPAAVAQMRRALDEGGRLAVATWRSDDEIPFIRELRRVAERRLGVIEDRRHSLGDGSRLETLLIEAGFHEIRVRTVSLSMRFDIDAHFERLNAMALVGMSAAGKTMSDNERSQMVEAIASDSASVLKDYMVGSNITFELASNLATAQG